VISGIARLERKSRELRLTNSRDGELRQVPLGLALVIALWSLGKVELAPSVVCTGELPEKDLWIDKGDSSRESKEPLRLREVNERSLRPGGHAETLSRQRWRSASVWYQSGTSSVDFR
jgi:hypothetical protein